MRSKNIIVLSLVIFFSSLFSLFSQDLVCGTIATEKDIEFLKDLKIGNANRTGARAGVISIAISAHIVRTTEGTGGLTERELKLAIEDVNEIYKLTNMEFFLYGEINYIDNNLFFDFNSNDEGALTARHDVENTINVYFFNSATSGESSVCGYAYFPESGIDHLVMVNSCTTNGSTFPHELGHYFALYHTHGKTNTGTTDEFVDGSNCTTAGDDICDTAADPNLSGSVNTSCVYTGNGLDAKGDRYEPNPKNLMSYSQKHCRDEFSQQQADRIVAAYQQYKTYLLSKPTVANFEIENKRACLGAPITFTNKSNGAVTYEWNFEGGVPAASNEENPSVTYNEEGSFDVSLTLTDADGETQSKIYDDYISVVSSVNSDVLARSGSFEEEAIAEVVLNNDEGITFAQSDVSSDGKQSMMLNFYDYGAVGESDYLLFATLNTSTNKFFELEFDVAYSSYSEEHIDGLELVHRDPCGNWQKAWGAYGEELRTAVPQTTSYAPASRDWKRVAILLQVDEETDVSEFAFKGINGYGNNLYIDNYSIQVADPEFEVSTISVTDVACSDYNDGSIEVEVSGAGSFQFSLDGVNFTDNNLLDGLTEGTYNVFILNDIGEIKEVAAVVGFLNDYPSTPEILVVDGNLVVESEEGQTVQWFLFNSAIEGATENVLTNPEKGNYLVSLSNGGCRSYSQLFGYYPLALEAENVISIYPNPVSNVLNIQIADHLQSKVNKVAILDLSGRSIRSYEFEQSLDLRSLEQGLYLLRIEVNGEYINRRFLKQ